MTHFNAKLWNIKKICVLQVLNPKEANLSKKKKEKNWLRKKCRDIISR